MKYSTCLNCEKRYYGCHSNCEDYKLFRADLDKIKQNKLAERDLHTVYRKKGRKRY